MEEPEMSRRGKIEIGSETAGQLYFLADGDNESEIVNGFQSITTEYLENSRWTGRYRLIIRRVADGALFAIDYGLGLTEYQDDDLPWEACGTVAARPVDEVQRMVTTYPLASAADIRCWLEGR
jgi:hypothetical protein